MTSNTNPKANKAIPTAEDAVMHGRLLKAKRGRELMVVTGSRHKLTQVACAMNATRNFEGDSRIFSNLES
jgi:hypothetical protein